MHAVVIVLKVWNKQMIKLQTNVYKTENGEHLTSWKVVEEDLTLTVEGTGQ